MIKNIIFIGFSLCLFIALAIKVVDPSITFVKLGEPFMSFMNSCNYELNSFRIAIPQITLFDTSKFQNIDTIEVNNAWDALRYAFTQVKLLNNILIGFMNFFNFFINIFNIVISVINVVLQLLQFIVIVIKNLITFKDNLIASA